MKATEVFDAFSRKYFYEVSPIKSRDSHLLLFKAILYAMAWIMTIVNRLILLFMVHVCISVQENSGTCNISPVSGQALEW